MNRTTQTNDHLRTGGGPRLRRVRILTALGIGTGLVLGASVPAQATEPSAEVLTEDAHGGVWIGEGIGTFPPDEEFNVMLDAERFDIPAEVELWAMNTEGETILIGEGETESAIYENPGSLDPVEQEVELISVMLPSSEVSTSDWHAFVAMDPATEELVTWSYYGVQLEDEDPFDFVDPPRDIWPIPDPTEGEEPITEAPSIESLTGETYGVVSLLEDSAMIPLNTDITFAVEGSEAVMDLWLVPPGGEDPVFLPTVPVEGTESQQWSTQVSSEDIGYNGIYAVVVLDSAGELHGWTTFGISVDGEPLQTSDPGVHEDDAAYSDRSIWPIPDSVPGPEDGEPEVTESPEPTTEPDESTTGPEESDSTDPTDEPEASEDPGAQNGQGDENGEDEQLAETGATITVLAVIAAAVLVLGTAVMIGINRRKAGQNSGQDS